MNQKSLINIDWSKFLVPKGEENLSNLNNYTIKLVKLTLRIFLMFIVVLYYKIYL